jgi:homoserine kinase
VIVRAPATSANLGPGFDCLGVALDLWNELEVVPGDGVVVEGVGADEIAADGSNLGVRAFARLADPAGLRFRFVNRIPLERGLGSSAAAIASGLVAAGTGSSVDDLLAVGLELESHGDNLAASLLGGVTLMCGGHVERIADRLPLDPVAVIPELRVRTTLSRHALPDVVSHADATMTVGNASLLTAAIITGDRELFARALVDRLHEPYRPSRILAALREELPPGARGATLSGSGPTVMVWADDAAVCAEALRKRFGEHQVLPLEVSPRGAMQSIQPAETGEPT